MIENNTRGWTLTSLLRIHSWPQIFGNKGWFLLALRVGKCSYGVCIMPVSECWGGEIRNKVWVAVEVAIEGALAFVSSWIGIVLR